MEFTLFAKKRLTRDGKPFYSFLATLKKKDGTDLVCAVKFNSDAGTTPKPEQCPMNIVVDKSHANLSTKKYTRQVTDPETGEISTEQCQSYTLWVSGWQPGAPYVDHSLDDIL